LRDHWKLTCSLLTSTLSALNSLTYLLTYCLLNLSYNTFTSLPLRFAFFCILVFVFCVAEFRSLADPRSRSSRSFLTRFKTLHTHSISYFLSLLSTLVYLVRNISEVSLLQDHSFDILLGSLSRAACITGGHFRQIDPRPLSGKHVHVNENYNLSRDSRCT